MALHQKMNQIMEYVNCNLAEREKLVHYIALALLTRNNLFVLGETGQAKSYAIDLFRSCIKGAKQYKTLMSKQTDQEQLFGRLDLSSIIPGNVSRSVLEADPVYSSLKVQLQEKMKEASSSNDNLLRTAIDSLCERLESQRKCLAELYGGRPEFVISGKIPDCHICFLDEIFKASPGVLNALLTATNEREYTNEGVTYKIPVISFFAASNEIPNFRDPEEKILRPLYDRFALKVRTEYVKDKGNRLNTLVEKQRAFKGNATPPVITLLELEEMQKDVTSIKITGSINELMDNILCELRKKEIHVSDRTYFSFGPIVQAEAWLNGRSVVSRSDMEILVNYLWNTPEEISVIQEVIRNICNNPMKDELDAIIAEANTVQTVFENQDDKDSAILTLKRDLMHLFDQTEVLRSRIMDDDAAVAAVDGAVSTLESISRKAHDQTTYTYITMAEAKRLQSAA